MSKVKLQAKNGIFAVIEGNTVLLFKDLYRAFIYIKAVTKSK